MGCDGVGGGYTSKESNINTYRNRKGDQLLQFYTFRFIAVIYVSIYSSHLYTLTTVRVVNYSLVSSPALFPFWRSCLTVAALLITAWKVERFTHLWALASVFFLHQRLRHDRGLGLFLTVTNGPSESGYSFTLKHSNLKLNSRWAGELYNVWVTPIPQSERYLYPWRHTFLFCACSDTWKGRRSFLCLQTHFSLVWSAVKCEFMFDHFLKHRMRCSSIWNAVEEFLYIYI